MLPLSRCPFGGEDHVMKNRIAFLLALLFVLTLNVPLEADRKGDWDRVVEAAKKERRLNLYVGHHRMESFPDTFTRGSI